MASSILEIPFRRTQSVKLTPAIKAYIESKFDQKGSQFEDDCRAIEALREDAIHVTEPHISGVDRLTAYANQLQYITTKFPLELGIEFAWWPALGYHKSTPVIHANIKFELANILFNLAALYSQLALNNNRTSSDGLKQAAQYGVAAAGTLFYLRTEILPDLHSAIPEDMDDVTLLSLENMCLAQAQECFWGKAVKDSMRDGTVARLAVQVSDYYDKAADYAIKSDAISTDWIHHFNAKHHHFAAAAQYRQSLDCMEKRQYGEEVARLKDCITCVNEGLKEKRWINRVVEGDLNGLKERVTAELKRAEKDNDLLYLIPVPPKSELRILDRANMVAPKPPREIKDGVALFGASGRYGRPLFENLVPFAVRQAATIYASRRDRISQSIIAEYEAMTSQLRELLSSLNLPASLEALEKPQGLPTGLLSKAEEMRQSDAPYRLKRTIEDTTRLKTDDLAIYQEGLALLQSEKQEDDRYRARYGTDRWRRPASEVVLAQYLKKSIELQSYLNSAGSSDSLVQSKMRENERIFRLLSGPERDLERYIPSSEVCTTSPAVEQAASRLRSVLNEVSRVETKRRRKIESIRAKARSDDISHEILKEAHRLEREYPMQALTTSQFEHLYESRLEAYEVDREQIPVEREEQDQLVARIREANKAFIAARRGETEQLTQAREVALQELENGYFRYKEVMNNLENGRKFYHDLAGHVTRFRDEVRVAVSQRRQEAAELEAEVGIGGMQLRERTELRNQKRAQQQAAQKTASLEQAQHPQVQAPQPQKPPVEALPAPVAARAGNIPPPTPDVIKNTRTPLPHPPEPKTATWDPSMGIRFG